MLCHAAVRNEVGVSDGIPTAPAALPSNQQQAMQSAPRSGAGASSSSSRSTSRSSVSASSTNSSSGSGGWNSTMLRSAPGMQLLLELLALLVAEAEGEFPVTMCLQLLERVMAGAPKAEKQAFLSAGGALLVQVLGLVVQAAMEAQQQKQGVQQEERERAMVTGVAANVLHCRHSACAKGEEYDNRESCSLLFGAGSCDPFEDKGPARNFQPSFGYWFITGIHALQCIPLCRRRRELRLLSHASGGLSALPTMTRTVVQGSFMSSGK